MSSKRRKEREQVKLAKESSMAGKTFKTVLPNKGQGGFGWQQQRDRAANQANETKLAATKGMTLDEYTSFQKRTGGSFLGSYRDLQKGSTPQVDLAVEEKLKEIKKQKAVEAAEFEFEKTKALREMSGKEVTEAMAGVPSIETLQSNAAEEERVAEVDRLQGKISSAEENPNFKQKNNELLGVPIQEQIVNQEGRKVAAQAVMHTAAQIYDAIDKVFRTNKKPAIVQKAEASFADATKVIELDIAAVKAGVKSPSDADRDFVIAALAINRLEETQHGINKINVNDFLDGGAEKETTIKTEKDILEGLRLRLYQAEAGII